MRIHSLGSADASCEGDHAGNVNPDRAITTPAQNAVSPNNAFDALQKAPIDSPLLLIQLSQGVDGLVRRHVLRVFVVGHVQEAAFCTETAMGTVRQEAFHFALLSIQCGSNFPCVNGACFLVDHIYLLRCH